MPRIAEPTALTPFAMVLTNYMWNKRPPNRQPLTTPQLAVRLGVPRQSVNNWIYKGNVPPIEAILAVLAQLDIPLRELYDAYKHAGLTVPRWDEADTEGPQIVSGKSVAERTKKQTAIAIPTTATTQTTAPTTTTTTTTTTTPTAPTPLPYTPPAEPYDRESLLAAEENRLIAQTRQALKESGASEELIAQAIAHIQAQRQQLITPREQQIIAEHTEPTQPAGSADTKPANNSPQTSKASKESNGGGTRPSRPSRR